MTVIERGRIGALIPVRLSSERLPGKALRQIKGRPVLYYLLDQVVACRYVEKPDIVVCTTEDPSDDALVTATEAYGATVFRGARDDIIKRFHDAMVAFDFAAVVQVDGDDPLTATEYMDQTMERLLSDPALGIVWSEGLPLGVNCKSLTRSAMDTVFRHYQQGQNDTGFIYFFTKTDLVKKAVVRPISPEHVFDDARLTLDYDVDFEVFRRIFEALEGDGTPCRLEQVVAYLKRHPEVASLNANVEEEYWQRTQEKAVLSYQDSDGETKRVVV